MPPPNHSKRAATRQKKTGKEHEPHTHPHKLFKVASDVKDKDGHVLVTAYAVQRPDGQWSVMFINKDHDNDHSVQVTFADPLTKRDRFFSGKVDRVVFGPAEYQWHADPPAAQPAAPPAPAAGGGRGGRGRGPGDPDGRAPQS